jgi:hypothetical protein
MYQTVFVSRTQILLLHNTAVFRSMNKGVSLSERFEQMFVVKCRSLFRSYYNILIFIFMLEIVLKNDRKI